MVSQAGQGSLGDRRLPFEDIYSVHRSHSYTLGLDDASEAAARYTNGATEEARWGQRVNLNKTPETPFFRSHQKLHHSPNPMSAFSTSHQSFIKDSQTFGVGAG